MTRKTMNPMRRALLSFFLACSVLGTSCMVGPTYQRASVPAPPAYKEEPPADFKESDGWKQAQPSDALKKGKWWEIFNDPALNALEEQVNVSNQNVLQAELLYRQAREAVYAAQAALYPTGSVAPAITRSRTNVAGTGVSASSFSFPAEVSWAPDLWGSVRRSVTTSVVAAQSLAAEVENIRLLYQSNLAQDYFNLHGIDAECDRLAQTYGERFAPNTLLRRMAERGERFYGATGAQAA